MVWTLPRIRTRVRRGTALIAVALATGGAVAQFSEHDPEALLKLYEGKVGSVDLSSGGRYDLAAILQAFIDEGCRYQARAGDPPINHAQAMARLTEGNSGAGGLVYMPNLLRGHPAFARTAKFFVTNPCASVGAQTVMRTMFFALQAAPAAAAPRNEPKVRLLRQVVNPWWKFQWGAMNPGGKFEATLGETRVVQCIYQPASGPSLLRYAWADLPPADSSTLARLSREHPIKDLGSYTTETCPKSMQEFDDAKAQARR